MSGFSCAWGGFLFGVIPFGFGPSSGGYDEAGFKDALFGKARLGGGTLPFHPSESKKRGLSPRGRGNRLVLPVRPSHDRSIPAWAGEPSSSGSLTAALRVYPRVGGGTVTRRR